MSKEVKEALRRVHLFDREENTGIHYSPNFKKMKVIDDGHMKNKYKNERSQLTLGYDRDLKRKVDPKTKQQLLDEILQKRTPGQNLQLEEALERRNYSKQLLNDRKEELKQMLDNFRDYF